MRDTVGATRPLARLRRVRRAVSLVVLALLLTACSGDQSALDPAGEFARKPDDLFQLVFWIAVGVFIIVQGLIIVTVVKFRQRPGDDSLPVQTHGNTRLEILWTVIPALILAGIAVPTVQTVFELADSGDDPMVVEVIGHRWWWEYRYPEHDIVTANELVIPTGRTIRLEMRAEESGSPDNAVIHSYWVPALGGKQDVIPGRTTILNIEADAPGTFLGQCGEYCGLSHANMRNYATALSPADFESWVSEQQQPAAAPQGELATEGARLFGNLEGRERSCVACHAIDGLEGAAGIQGPDLTHLMSRERFAGAIFDLDEQHLRDWLRNPLAMKPMQPEIGVGMPNLNLTEDEIDALVAYLLTLE